MNLDTPSIQGFPYKAARVRTKPKRKPVPRDLHDFQGIVLGVVSGAAVIAWCFAVPAIVRALT